MCSNQLSYVARLFLDGWGTWIRTRECRYQKPVPTAWRYPNNRAVNRLLEEDGWVPGFEPGNAGIKNRCLTAWHTPSVQRFLVNGAGGET